MLEIPTELWLRKSKSGKGVTLIIETEGKKRVFVNSLAQLREFANEEAKLYTCFKDIDTLDKREDIKA